VTRVRQDNVCRKKGECKKRKMTKLKDNDERKKTKKVERKQ
jgi:hypothetical protein